MTWFNVDDVFWRSVKRGLVSTAAVGLWACAGSWSRENRTGGIVPRSVLRQIVPDLSEEQAVALATELVEAKVPELGHNTGLWLPMTNGWQFHDWQDWQPETEKEAERRDRISKVRAEAGRRGAQARWHGGDENGFANAKDGKPRDPAGARTREDPGSDPVSLPPGEDVSDPDPSLPTQPRDLTGIQEAYETGDWVTGSVADDLAEGATGRVSAADTGTGRSDKDAARAASRRVFRSDDERAVFDHWASTVWRKVHTTGEARATPRRVSPIRARLRDGFTAEQLNRVSDAVALSSFHLGDNDSGKAYIEPGTIFRNREKVEEWLARRWPARAAGGAQRSGWKPPEAGDGWASTLPDEEVPGATGA